MIRKCKPLQCLFFLLCLSGISPAFGQTFPLGDCKKEISADSDDCVLFKPGKPDTKNDVLRQFRTVLGEPDSMSLGVALSGGGSKAAPFAMGVLAGLSDSGLLDKVDAVSTVSGGSYAAYFYFNRLVARHKMRMNGEAVPADYVSSQFRDCTYAHQSLPKSMGGKKINLCEGLRDAESPLNNIHQAFVRCRQDLVEPMNCSASAARPDSSDPGALLGLLAATAISLPFHHVANTFLDLGVNMSPTRMAYQAGLGSAYGLIPVTQEAIPLAGTSRRDLASPTPRLEYFANARMVNGMVQPVPYTFEDLRLAYRDARRTGEDHVPLWIANAHAAKSRSLWGWLTWRDPDFDRDIFEFTPFYAGSGRYGYWNKPMRGMDLLGATTASAAFLDATGANYRGLTKWALALLQHGLNADWGTDIRNWNVGPERLEVRPLLFVPMYWMDSAASRAEVTGKEKEKERVSSPFIRLIDGGNGDDLGAYSLISRGVENIIIADAAQDFHGKMDDLCVLHQQLKHRKLKLHVPALAGLDAHCETLDGTHVADPMGYPVREWPYPVIAGCVVDAGKDDESKPCENENSLRHRIFLVKPAIDLKRFLQAQATTQPESDIPRKVARCAVQGDSGTDDLPCETAGFIIDHIDSVRHCRGFPQHSTVLATAYSSAALYGAYREMARHYVRGLGEDVNALKRRFNELLKDQREHPMPLSLHEECGSSAEAMAY